MRNIFIFMLSMSIITHISLKPAALLSPRITTKASMLTSKTSQKILGEKNTKVLRNYFKISKYCWDLYWKKICNPNETELKQQALWYGIKSGTARSLTGEDPIKVINKYNETYQNHFSKKQKNNKFLNKKIYFY